MAANITIDKSALTHVFTFGFVDYVVFVILLGISAGIGLYFGFFSKAGNTTDEYLHGGKQMKTLPIAISLVASQLSGISIMAIPAEIYGYGINYLFTIVSIILVVPALSSMAIPVFYENNISNCYEYLQRRFNKTTRQIVTVLFILTTFFSLPVYIFIPSLAFSQVTGNNIHLINAIVCSICVFYTMLGGIKAVVWTDVVQALVMIGSIMLIAVMGVIGLGGLGNVFQIAIEGGRMDLNFELDLQTRATVWNAFTGSFCMWGSYVGFNQSCVQRIVALPSLSHAKNIFKYVRGQFEGINNIENKRGARIETCGTPARFGRKFDILSPNCTACLLLVKSLYIFAVGFLIIMLLNVLTGIIIFVKYSECDPIAMKIVDKADKIVPYFVQDVIGHLHGMPGVFISCVFSASLSTISANLNSLSGIIYFDCVKPYIKHSEWKANLFMKICVVVIGTYCVIGGIVVEQFKSILQVVYTIAGVSHGAVFGIFTVGLLVPRVHGKAGLIGLALSLIVMLVICFGAQREINAGELSYEPLPVRTDGCEDLNTTSSIQTNIVRVQKEKVKDFSIFKISFYWYAVVGTLLVWLTSFVMSFIITSEQKPDSKLMSPFVRSIAEDINNIQAEEVPLKAELKVET